MQTFCRGNPASLAGLRELRLAACSLSLHIYIFDMLIQFGRRPQPVMEQIVFTRAGIIELHAAMHERLDLLLGHIATVPDELWNKPISGFGHPSVWKQLAHILTCEEGWVHDLQNKSFTGWYAEDCRTMAMLQASKERIRDATRSYLANLSEEQLNTTLATRPAAWAGELRSPVFILLHIITHAFHHKGQIVAMVRILGYPAPDTDLQPV